MQQEGHKIFLAKHQKGRGKSNVTALRRNDSKHEGIYIQIFKHSWKDAWTEIPFLCSPCRNEFNTQPDANAKWLKLFLASIAKLPLFVKRIEFSCGYSSWLHSASICTLFFFFNPPKQRQLYLSPPSPPLCWLGIVKWQPTKSFWTGSLHPEFYILAKQALWLDQGAH